MTTTLSSLLVETSLQGVMTIHLNRPDVHNAFNEVMIAELTATLKNCIQQEEVRIVVLRGKGKSFSAGADLNWMQKMVSYSFEENRQDADALAELMFTLKHLNRPTIAVAQGPAFGGGVGLLACCDFVLASQQANFCLSEVKLGLVPAIISPYVIAAMGERAAYRYSLSAERFSVEEAQRLNLVTEIANDDAIEEKLNALIAQLLNNSPQAMAVCKELFFKLSESKNFSEARQMTVEAIAALRVSEEGQEGLQAFLQKRKAEWTK